MQLSSWFHLHSFCTKDAFSLLGDTNLIERNFPSRRRLRVGRPIECRAFRPTWGETTQVGCETTAIWCEQAWGEHAMGRNIRIPAYIATNINYYKPFRYFIFQPAAKIITVSNSKRIHPNNRPLSTRRSIHSQPYMYILVP
jgi:hypothetical protein